jgi:hypothetical protein
MSGSGVKTTVGLDAIANMLQAQISYFKIGEGGFILSPEVTEVIDASASGAEDNYTHTISGGDFAIIDINLVTNEVEISGEYADFFPGDVLVRIENSSGNDGAYTVDSGGATESGGNTFIKFNETIPVDTADGLIYVTRLPVAIGPSDDSTHYPLVVEEITGISTVVQSVTDTTGEGGLTGDGTGTINYKTGALDVTFDDPVGAGNVVRVRFKYHDRRKDASVGVAYTDIEAIGSPLASDGNPELFTFTKSFGADVDTEVIVRGTGYATVRCKMKLQAVEGIDDGRGSSYGGTPYYFEGGIFDSNDVLIAYFTFDKQRKVAPLEIVHTFDFIF